MISHHCQMTVHSAVSRLKSAQVQELKPTELIINLDTAQTSVEQLLETVEKAGYSVTGYTVATKKTTIESPV